MAAHAQAQVQKLQGDAAASMALAKERQVNAVRGVHDMHSDFSAPPYGQPHAQDPPDPPALPLADPNAMAPDMAVAHQLADLCGKHAQAALNERKAMHVDAGFMHHGNCAVGKSPKARRGGLAIRPSFLH